MHSNSVLLVALLSAYVNALPLNINLGAYSPALVVGDGEISFGGKQDVSNLMNALEGAAVAGGAAAAAAPAAQAAQPAQVTANIQAAPVDGSTQITSLQGMGKEIAPRVVQLVKTDPTKRDIQGFNAALKFASDALKTSPEIQLGTGEGGSGVGITQKAGGTTSTAAGAAKAVLAKKEEMASPRVKTTVTTMFVRGGPAVARSEESSVEKRSPAPVPAPALDGVNLNMAEGQVAELTFVETRSVDDDE